MRFLKRLCLTCKCVSATSILLLCTSSAYGQGASPETAPPLFPGGGLISYNSVFATRSLMQEASAGIPATARPTFSHEGDFNFTWGFHPDFDLTILVPLITNDFQTPSVPTVGGTGLGDVMVLVKYRFYRRDSSRGTTQASFTVGPKLPTGRTDLTSERKPFAGDIAARFRFDRFLCGSELDLHRTLQRETACC